MAMDDKSYTYDYFISYRRASGGYEYAQKIRGILMKYGKKVFVDKNNLEIGEYPEPLENAIENSKAFILILNEDSWRQDTEIDVYYEEIIRMAKTTKAILIIEFAAGVLNSVPKILADELDKENCKLSNLEKIFVYQNPYYNFEAELCSKIGVAYQAIDPKLQKFTMFQLDSLIDRSKVDVLYESICDHRLCNLVGIGGSGKTSLTYLLAKKYGDVFNNIAYVVINCNVKDDFIESMNKTLNICEQEDSPDVKYNKIIAELKKNYSVGNNLLILDVNEMLDKKAIDVFVAELIDFPNNWKFLILSREQINNCHHNNLDDDVDKNFLKKMFVAKVGTLYDNFADFDALWDTIYYSPLLAEQLGIYLNYLPVQTFEEIKRILYDDLLEEEMTGIIAFNYAESTLGDYLINLVNYQNFSHDETAVLRHFVLWGREYIGSDIVEDLLQGVCKDLESTLKLLLYKNILSVNSEYAYKLHGLLNFSLRQQIVIENEDWSIYLSNIERVIGYTNDKFESYIDCIGNSLKMISFLNPSNKIAYRFYCLYKQINNKKLQSFINQEPIYISYAHNNPKNEGQEHIADVVDSLIELFINNGIQYRVDEKLEGGDSITEFESAIGDSMYLIIVYSKKYFESPHCMYEFKKIINSNVAKKIIYINSDNININDEITRLNLFRVWSKVEEKLIFKNPDTLSKIELAAKDNRYYKDEIIKLHQIINDINHYKTNSNYQLSDERLAHLINSVKNWFLNT